MKLFVRINLMLILLFCTILTSAQAELQLENIGDFTSSKESIIALSNVQNNMSENPDSCNIISIPSRGDWSASEEVIGLQLGPPGSWDDFNPGAITPCTIVKLSGTYYLYYIGSDGKRDHDDGPAHRKLGLATSSNGIDFTKYEGNPILSWSPMNNDEEGIFGAKALSIDGKIHLYLNTISAKNASTDQVWADVHLLTSTDGKHFSKPVLVLDHSNAAIIGYGDELGPSGIMYNDGKWTLYYFAKGIGMSSWGLCLATGDSPVSFGSTKPMIDEKLFFGTGGDVHCLSNSKIAMFFQKRSDWSRIEVYTALADNPDKLTKVKTWDGFVQEGGVTVFLDKRAGKWFMYNRRLSDGSKMYVRIAPVKYEVFYHSL